MTHYLIREMIPEERPRERLLSRGPEALSITELLAILIGTGRRDHSALDIARELTGDFLKDARLARTQDPRELTRIPGIGPAKATVIMAALELGRRLAGAEGQPRKTIHCPEDGAMLVMPRLRYETHEHFWVILLNSKGKVTGIEPISEGSLNASVVHPPGSVRSGTAAPCSSHPGSAQPSFRRPCTQPGGPGTDPDPVGYGKSHGDSPGGSSDHRRWRLLQF